MAVREYIGARYTIKVYSNSVTPSTAEWEANVSYEAITLVTFNTVSYLSKKPVPSTVGDPASNPDYWVAVGSTTAQINQLQSDVSDIQAYLGNYITPDDFTGSDTAKLQAAFDSLKATGGTIILNRIYTLTGNIKIEHDTEPPSNNVITLIGLGSTSGINFATYHFEGYDNNQRTWGGLQFINCHLFGTDKGFIGNYLIRIFFENCTIEGFNKFVYGDQPNSAQTVFFTDCYIRSIPGHIVYTTNNAWDIHFSGCLVEHVTTMAELGDAKGLFVTNNLIEGVYDDNYTNKKIVINGTYQFYMTDNYCENNAVLIDMTNGYDIDYSKAVIANNKIIEEYNGINNIILPADVSHACIIIEGNAIQMYGTGSYGIAVTSNNTYKNLIVRGSVGTSCPIYVPNHRIHDTYTQSDIAAYSTTVNMTPSPDVYNRIFKTDNVRRMNIMFTLNEAVASGSTLFTLDDLYDAPQKNTIFTIKELDSVNNVTAQYWSEVSDNGTIFVRHPLTSGSTYMIDATWTV